MGEMTNRKAYHRWSIVVTLTLGEGQGNKTENNTRRWTMLRKSMSTIYDEMKIPQVHFHSVEEMQHV